MTTLAIKSRLLGLETPSWLPLTPTHPPAHPPTHPPTQVLPRPSRTARLVSDAVLGLRDCCCLGGTRRSGLLVAGGLGGRRERGGGADRLASSLNGTCSIDYRYVGWDFFINFAHAWSANSRILGSVKFFTSGLSCFLPTTRFFLREEGLALVQTDLCSRPSALVCAFYGGGAVP